MKFKLNCFLTCLLVLIVHVGYAQTKVLTGVVSEGSSPLPGVSIVIQGTQEGVQTDLDGKYSINVKTGDVLVFSFIGMKDVKHVVDNASFFNVSMNSQEDVLDVVVVTAMGIKRSAKALGYATQEIKGDKLNQTDNSSLSGALQGKVSGVQITPSSGAPGASSQIVIRGARSFTGNNTPLYVIDGMPVESTADFSTGGSVSGSDIANRAVDIDPNDIETINILKGQAASALYGIRASNGVIVITTKSGKGLEEGKPVISFSSSSSFETLSKKPSVQKTYAQGNYDEASGRYLYSPYSSLSWGPKISDLPNDPNYGGNVANDYNKGVLQPGKYYVPQLAAAGMNPWVAPRAYDNIGDFFKTGNTLTNSFNISQNAGKTNYSFGFGNTTQDGMMPGTDMKRTNIKLAADTKLSKEWTTGFSANYVTTDINKATSANDSYLPGVFGGPTSYDMKGIPSEDPTDPYKQIYFRNTTFNNPYWAANHNEFSEKTARFYGNANIAYSPVISDDGTKNLTIKYQGGVDSYTTNLREIYEYGNAQADAASSSVGLNGITRKVMNSLFTVNYDMYLADDLRFDILLGNEFNEENSKVYQDFGSNLNFGGWATIANTLSVSSRELRNQKRTVGLFSNAGFSYKDMLFLSGSIRKDVVSTMPRNNRSFVYPSVSLGFVLSELEGLKGNSILSFAKIRASYAEVGQAGTYLNNYYSKPGYGGGFWTGEPIIYPVADAAGFAPTGSLYDPKLKPQNTKSWELGTDLRFLNNRFGVDYTFSRQDVKDQIFDVPLAGSSGASSFVTNGGKIHTVAHEIMAFVSPIKTNDLEWTVNVNFSKIDSYVDELKEGVNNIFLGGFTTPQIRAQKGDRFPVIYGESFQRDPNGKIIVDNDGIPLLGETKALGEVAPKFILGGSTFLTWKKWHLNGTVEWKHGGNIYSGSNSTMRYYGADGSTSDRDKPFIFDGVKQLENGSYVKNDIVIGSDPATAAYERQIYESAMNSITEASVFDASFVKLREVSLGYTFDKIFTQKINLRLSAFARNILLWSKMPNLDPEATQGNTNMSGGFEQWSVPQAKSIGFSLNVTF